MGENEILKRVSEYLVKQLEIPPEKIRPEANLFRDLGMDSIDALDWFAAMQSEIGLPIIEKELKRIRTVQDVVDYLVRNLGKNAEPLG